MTRVSITRTRQTTFLKASVTTKLLTPKNPQPQKTQRNKILVD